MTPLKSGNSSIQTRLPVLSSGPARPLIQDAAPAALSLEEFKRIALEAGADDASAVTLDHPDLAEERPHVLSALSSARTLVVFVMRTHRDDIKSPLRSVANHEFHRTGHETDEVAARIARKLAELGHESVNPPMAFPMEMSDFPERGWIVSHKRVAEAASLGKMGIHRSVIHPVFGSFVLLGTVITSAELEGQAPSLSFNPCLECKLCVAACPVGALEPDGTFRFSACYNHNYREFMTGFQDFVEEAVESKSRAEFRRRVTPSETVSMWQSLAYKPNYKAAYCIAVCPAGESVITPFKQDRAGFVSSVLRPLTKKVETVYAVEHSDAAAYVQKRFPHKKLRVIHSSLEPRDARGFFFALDLIFQRALAKGWKGTFHFDLEDRDAKERLQVTVVIDNGTLLVDRSGLVGDADVVVQTTTELWLDVALQRRSPVWLVLTGRLKIRGNRTLLDKFSRCFPR